MPSLVWDSAHVGMVMQSSAPPEVSWGSTEGVSRTVFDQAQVEQELLLGISHDRDGKPELSPFTYALPAQYICVHPKLQLRTQQAVS